MIKEQSEPAEGASCPLSHRILRKTMFGIVRLMLILIAICLIYLAFSSR